MCGLAGIFAPEGVQPDHVARTAAMLRTLRHRGPDGFSVLARDNAVLGHARLATIDLVTGDQPIGNEDGSIQVVLNGEIYNYKELRTELEGRGHRFTTQSDTEVIPHLYEELGPDCVRRLRGMFVITLHDARKGLFLIARDRLGKKPLYYARTPLGFHYASEPRALLACDDVDRRIDAEAIAHFLTWQYVPAPWSIYKGIRKLPAASVLVLDRDGNERIKTFWDDSPRTDVPLDSAEALQRLREVLREACRIRLRADVPLGAFLSGGIDSGIVAALSARELDRPLLAVSVGFGTPQDELELARMTAKRAGLQLEERMLEVDLVDTVDRVLGFLDEPHGDSSCVPTWLVCAAAREQVTVALSGDGGDEAFAGYASRYSEQLLLEKMRRAVPGSIRRAVFGPMARVWPESARLPRPFRLGRVLESVSGEAFEAYAADRSIWRHGELDRMGTPAFRTALDGFDTRESLRSLFDRCDGADPLERLLYLDRHTYLAEGVLAKVDRMSMAHSLEVRSPLLDQEVIELSLRVAPEEKLSGGVGKRLLRRLASELLPEAVTAAKKSGFAPPVREWLRGPLRGMVRDRLLDPKAAVHAVIDAGEIRRMIVAHELGSRDFSQKLWCLLALETWARTWAPKGLLA